MKQSQETDCEHAGRNRFFNHYVSLIIQSRWFTAFFLLIIILDSVFIAHLINPALKNISTFFKIADKLFLSVYLMEFVIRVYVDPRGYWRRPPNILSALILLVACTCVFVNVVGQPMAMQNVSVLRVFLTFRLLTILPHLAVVQTLAAGYWRATKIVIHFFGWIFVVIMIFAVVGHDLFEDPHTGDPDNWGDHSRSLMSLFFLVALDDWTLLKQRFDDLGMDFSWIFIFIIIIIVPFLLIKLIIGVYTSEMTNTSVRMEKNMKIEMMETKAHKHLLNQEQEKRMKERLQKQAVRNRDRDLETEIGQIEEFLSHNEIIVTKCRCASLSFIKMYLSAVYQQNETLIELQQLNSEMLQVLWETLEDRLHEESAAKGKRSFQ